MWALGGSINAAELLVLPLLPVHTCPVAGYRMGNDFTNQSLPHEAILALEQPSPRRGLHGRWPHPPEGKQGASFLLQRHRFRWKGRQFRGDGVQEAGHETSGTREARRSSAQVVLGLPLSPNERATLYGWQIVG